MIIALWWIAWNTRNLFVFEKKMLEPQRAVAKAEAMAQAYARVKMSKGKVAARTEVTRKVSWLSPPQGTYKINFDAAINRETHQGGLGVVIRGGNGSVLTAAVQQINFNGDVAQIGAAAVKLGIQMAKDGEWTPLIIETDCKEVVELVLQKKSSRTEICWIIADIQNKMEGDNMTVIRHIPSCACFS